MSCFRLTRRSNGCPARTPRPRNWFGSATSRVCLSRRPPRSAAYRDRPLMSIGLTRGRGCITSYTANRFLRWVGKNHFFAGHWSAIWRIEGRGAAIKVPQMSVNPKQVREIFVAANKLAPEQWDAYLGEACAGNDPLGERVRHLLNANREAGSFLEPVASDSEWTDAELIRERPGTHIGPYKLLEQIGEGGFGIVF